MMKKSSKQIHKEFCDYEINKAKQNRMARGGSVGFILHKKETKSHYEIKKEFEKLLNFA